MSAPPNGADITDAVTRSAIVLLFKQFVLATPKTRSLTITIGDIKIIDQDHLAASAAHALAGCSRAA